MQQTQPQSFNHAQQQQFAAPPPPSGRHGGPVGGPASMNVGAPAPRMQYGAVVAPFANRSTGPGAGGPVAGGPTAAAVVAGAASVQQQVSAGQVQPQPPQAQQPQQPHQPPGGPRMPMNVAVSAAPRGIPPPQPGYPHYPHMPQNVYTFNVAPNQQPPIIHHHHMLPNQMYPPPNGSVRGGPAQMTPQQQYAAFSAGPGPQPVTVPQQQYMYAAPNMYPHTGFYMPAAMPQMVATPPQMGGPGQAAPVSVAGVPRPQPTQTPPVLSVPPISQIGMQMQAPQVPQNMSMGPGPQHMGPQMPVQAAVTAPTPLSSNKQRSRSKAIPIINPETGKNVMEAEGQTAEKTEAAESVEAQSQKEPAGPAAGVTASTLAPSEAEQSKSSSAPSDVALKTREEFAKKVGQLAGEKDLSSAARDVVADQTTTASEVVKPKSDDLQTSAIHTEEKPAVATIASTPADSKSGPDASTPASARPLPAAASESARPSEAKGTASEEDATEAEPLSPDGKSKAAGSKKPKGNARKAELNRKGNEKLGGSDMDAFVGGADTSETDSAPAQPAVPSAAQPEVGSSAAPQASQVQSNHVSSREDSLPAAPQKSAVPVEGSEDEDSKKPASEDVESDSASDVGEKANSQADQLKLKYKYNEGQWSPQNPEGKKQYDRDFLMQLQKDPMSLRKPENLPAMDIVKDKVNQRLIKFPTQKSGNDWLPDYVKPTLSKQTMNVTKRGSQNGGKKPDGGKKIIILPGISIQEKVELKTAENAWRPGKSVNGAELDVIQDLSKKARGILNKLTPQKFDTLVERFNELSIDTEEKLRTCMELVFEKAVDEPEFSVAYARMCEVLQKKQVNVTETGQPINFRKLLITRVQQEFERDYMDGLDKANYERNMEEATTEERKKELRLEFEDKERRARRRSLGNIRFIGELYKLKMLTARIMHECVRKLLKAGDEESLECLCRLLTTVGKDLENETNAKIREAQGSKDAQPPGFTNLNNYFHEMQGIIDNKQTSSRVRFMLQDLQEVRLDNWKPRRDVAGPKTIDQIHKEVEREKNQQQLENLLNKPTRGGPPGGSGGMDRDRDRDRGDRNKRSSRGPAAGSGQSSNAQEDGWTNVPARPARPSTTYTYDPNRLSSMTGKMGKVDADSMQLGPGSKNQQFTAWGKGSAGTRLSQTKEDVQKNRFAAFSEQAPSSSTESDLSRRGASRSMGMSDSRGASADERQRAVQAVMNMAGGGAASPASRGAPPAAGSSSAAAAQPTPATGDAPAKAPTAEEAAQAQAAQLRGQPDLTDDEVEKLAKPLLDEYIHNCDVKEAIACICEKFHSTTISMFVRTMVNSFLERSVEARRNVGTLLEHLVKKHILLEEQYKQGFGFVLEDAGEMVVDIPKFWDYLAEILAPSLEHGTISLRVIAKLAEDLKNEEFAGRLMASVLHSLSTRVGHVRTGGIWSDSGVKWEQLIGKQDVKAFLEANKLEYTLEDAVAVSRNGPRTSNLTPEAVASALKQRLKSDDSNDGIFDWIDSQVGESARENWFIRILVETVAESVISGPGSSMCELNKSQLTNRATLLKRYLENQLQREKQGLYALQHLMHRLEHPNKLLHQIFEALYDADTITQEAFEEWEKCNDPAEQEGKGVAIKSTTQFFTWLREAEEEEEDD